MGDIAPCIINRRLSDILIPGSHDSATYGMSAAAKTQSLDLYNQLDAGARQFDIRVEWNHNVPADQQGYYAHHGDPGKLDEISNTLSLANIFTQLGQWADAGSDALNHGQEII